MGVLALAAGAYGLGVFAAGGRELHGTALDSPLPVGDIVLQGADGEPVALGDFRGRYLLVFFGFRNCKDVCPLTLGRLAEIYRDLGEPPEVQVAFITVDPARDTPELTQEYASGFHPSFVGLGGSSEAVARAAKRFFVGFNGDGRGGVNHTDMVLLVDRQGRYRMVYNTERLRYVGEDLSRLLAGRGL